VRSEFYAWNAICLTRLSIAIISIEKKHHTKSIVKNQGCMAIRTQGFNCTPAKLFPDQTGILAALTHQLQCKFAQQSIAKQHLPTSTNPN
jgi:hypothetical protein